MAVIKPIFLLPVNDSDSFSNYSFYNLLLLDIVKHYKDNANIPPVLSLELTEYIDPAVLPNLISLGIYLKKFNNNKPLELKLSYKPYLLHYLQNVGFFNIVNMANPMNPEGLNIFKFDERFIGGFSNYDIKDKRKEHKIRCYLAENNYNLALNDSEKEEYRDRLVERLENIDLPNHFGAVLNDKELTRERLYESYERLAEPISNGILHSQSPTTALIQTTKYKTSVSVSDAGIGFEKSFSCKNIKFDLIDRIKSENQFTETLHDFYIILQILYYSMTKIRNGLIDFIIDVILVNNGTVRLHYNSTQIIITTSLINQIAEIYHNRTEFLSFYTEHYYGNTLENSQIKNEVIIKKKKCMDSVLLLGNALKKSYRKDKKYSLIRIYDVSFKGVHIEMEII